MMLNLVTRRTLYLLLGSIRNYAYRFNWDWDAVSP